MASAVNMYLRCLRFEAVRKLFVILGNPFDTSSMQIVRGYMGVSASLTSLWLEYIGEAVKMFNKTKDLFPGFMGYPYDNWIHITKLRISFGKKLVVVYNEYYETEDGFLLSDHGEERRYELSTFLPEIELSNGAYALTPPPDFTVPPGDPLGREFFKTLLEVSKKYCGKKPVFSAFVLGCIMAKLALEEGIRGELSKQDVETLLLKDMKYIPVFLKQFATYAPLQLKLHPCKNCGVHLIPKGPSYCGVCYRDHKTGPISSYMKIRRRRH